MNCRECEHRKGNYCEMGGCEEHPANGAHPLSPCVRYDCMNDDDEPECYTNEEAIMEGNRCLTYISWLHKMHENHRTWNNCSYPFCRNCDHIEESEEEENTWFCGRKDMAYFGWEVLNKSEGER